MEVHLTPDTERKLKDLAAQTGRGTDDLVEDAMAGYVEELLQAREMLNNRYDDLRSGRVKPIAGDEVAARFMTGYAFHPAARVDLDEIWEFIRADDLDAADRIIAEILTALMLSSISPTRATGARTSPHDLCDSQWCANT